MRADASRADIVGRAEVLARLDAVIAGALAGRSGALLLAGEAGIGKTTLLSAAAGRAEAVGARVARAWGWPGEGAPAFWLWRQVLRDLDLDLPDAGIPDTDLPASDLPGPIRSTMDNEGTAARFALFDQIASRVLAESRIQPVVLLLDDLQWADEASLRLAEFVLRRMPAGALALIGAYRDTAAAGLPFAAAIPIQRLGGLGPDAVAGLVARTSGREIDAAAAAQLWRRTAGNPFLVQQMAWLAPAEAMPPGVGAVLAERFADLPPTTVDMLGAAAAMGSTIRPATLAAVTGCPRPAVTDALAPAQAARIIVVDPVAGEGIRFAHDLLREYAYEQVPLAARNDLHRRIAEALEARHRHGEEVEPAEIAEHHVAADPSSTAAYEWSAAAARDAGRRLAYEQAVRHWQHAVAAAGEHRPAALLALAEAARRAGDPELAIRTYERAAELARRDGDGDVLGRVALGLHTVGRRTFSDSADLVSRHDEALSMMEPSPLRLRVMASLARVLAWDGSDPTRARGLAEAAVAAARMAVATAGITEATNDEGRPADLAGPGADPATLAECLLARQLAFAGPGTIRERVEHAGELIVAATTVGEPDLIAQARLLSVSDLLELADPGFRSELDEFFRLADAAGEPRLRYAALVRRTMLALLAGQLGEVERLIGAATALGHEVGEPATADVHFEHSWDLAAARGELGEAMGLVQQAFPDPDSPQGRGLRVLVLLAMGDRTGARELAAPLLESPPATTVPGGQWLLDLAYAVELVVGVEARQPARWLYDTLQPYGDLVVVSGVAIAVRGAVAHLLGLLARVLDRPADAHAQHERAARIHERLGAVLWTLRSRFELARLDADPVALTEIATRARRLGAFGLADEAQAEAARVGGTTEAVFHRDGAQWTLTYAGTTVRLPDAKGLADLAVLLAGPGQPVSAADLVAAAGAGELARADLGLGADAVLDETARVAYRRRLAELAEVIEQAERWSDLARAERARDERAALLAELAAAAGVAGRERRLGDQSERARKAVTARIRDSLRRISAAHPVLGAHLSASVSTGTWCDYSPPSPVAWRI